MQATTTPQHFRVSESLTCAREETVMQARADAILPPPDEAWTRHIHDWLTDAERQMQDALTQTQATGLRCQQALAALAGLRAHIASSPGGDHPAVMFDSQVDVGSQRCGDVGTELGRWRGSAVLALVHAPDGVPDRCLSPRETDVLALIAAGHSNKGIASRLCLSVRTVERHINNLYRKIDAHNKADATAYAIRHHIA